MMANIFRGVCVAKLIGVQLRYNYLKVSRTPVLCTLRMLSSFFFFFFFQSLRSQKLSWYLLNVRWFLTQ